MIKCILEFTEDKEITENKINTVFKNQEILRLEFKNWLFGLENGSICKFFSKSFFKLPK